MIKHVPVDKEGVQCSNCLLGHLCLPQGMSPSDIERLSDLVKERIRLSKGETLYHVGHETDAIYSVRTGTIKTQIEQANAYTQITGFFLPGEIFGLDSMTKNRHLSHAIALEDSEVCVMTLRDLHQLSASIPSLLAQVQRLLTGEIARSHQMMLSLGVMRSEQRVASFILNLSDRFARLGYSSQEFNLRMSREEIGNYLGLTLETTSRIFSRFQKDGLIQTQQRAVRIVDRLALQALLS